MCHSVNKRLLIFLGMIALTAFGARATDYIDNEDQLKTIASQGGSASLIADIRLSSCLEIPADKEVTLYITDYTLSRALSAAEEEGHVILNRGKLTIQGNGLGTIAGGWATIGGGIYNAAGATLIINDITVSGNKATEAGGGIANYGQMTVKGCTFTNNQSKFGAGMLVDQGSTGTAFTGTNTITQNVSSCDAGAIYFNRGILKLEGKPYFRNNAPSDVLLVGDACFTISGSFEEGASIGVNPTIDGPIAYNYQNSEEPSKFFVSAPNDADIQLLDDRRVTYTTTAVYYLDRKPGSDPTNVSEEKIKVSDRFESLHSSGSDVTLNEGWYIVNENVAMPMMTISGKVNIIILNGKTLKCSKGIRLTQGNELHIYSQKGDGGILLATADDDDDAGIGSTENQNAGSLYVHSGQVYATGSKYGAGIGGGDSGYGGEVTIYGGTVIARSKGAGAGIGGGRNRDNGNITIYGGYVEAYGYYDSDTDADHGGSGIGGGSAGSQAGTVTVNGGKVYAHGGSNAAGIGGGMFSSGGANGGLVVVNGGKVYAYGGVTAYGSKNSGAGIGGGRAGNAGTLRVNGGTVTAFGGRNAPAVGRGSENETTTGSVEFNGGKLIASSFNTSIPALGYGTVSVGNWRNNYMFILGEDEKYCAKLSFHDPTQQSDYELKKEDVINALTHHQNGVDYSYVRIEPCDHASKLISKRTAASHTYDCQYCYLTSVEEEHTLSLGKCTLCNSFILQDGSDNTFNLSYGTGLADHVILANRLLYKDGAWNTLCLPFSISDLSGTIFEGATIKTLEYAGFDEEEGKLTLNFSENSLSSIEAGVPYIVKWPSEDQNLIIDPEFNDVTISDTYNNKENGVVNFIGTYSPVSITAADPTVLYLGHGDTLYYPSSAMTINAFRAYFKLNLPSSLQVKAFTLNFGDEETGIKAVSQPSTLNPELSHWFTLDGRRLSDKPASPGIYIHRGRKVVIK